MTPNNLILYKKTETILIRLYPYIAKFPKSEKYSLCPEIKSCLYNVLKYICLANNVKVKRFSYAQEASAHLELLKVLLNLSRQMKYIGISFYEEISVELTEISMIMSGYIKSAK